MLDSERNPKTTYRVSQVGDLYVVTTYPKSPDPIAVASYRFDLLPQWLQEAMHILDWAHPEFIEGLGKRVGPTDTAMAVYWIEAQEGDYANLFVNAMKSLDKQNPERLRLLPQQCTVVRKEIYV